MSEWFEAALRAPTYYAAAAAGFAFAPIFRRHEPTLNQFIGIVIGVAFSARLGTMRSLNDFVDIPVLNTLACVGAFLAALSTSIIYYRIFSTSHPLHAIPGPLLARSTKFWLLAKVLSGNVRQDLAKVHAKYGPVVRIAPNEISVADTEAILQIHGAKSWIRGDSYSGSVHSKSGIDLSEASLLSLSDHSTHTPRRKLWDRAFTIGSLRDYEPMLLKRISQLCKQMDARAGTTIDLNEWLGFLVFDVTSDLAYGGGTNFLNDGADPTGIVHGVVAALRLQGRTMAVPWLAPLYHKTPLAKKSGAFVTYCRNRFAIRYKEGSRSGGKDFLYHLLNEGEDDGSALKPAALASEATLIMAAGADTTRLAISIIFMFMLRQPELYRQLQKVVDEALDGNDVDKVTVDGDEYPEHDRVKNIPLLEAFINEALRVHPPLSVEPVRTAPPEGTIVAGVFIPGGSQVRVPASVIQRDPHNFESPTAFKPERWLKPNLESGDQLFNKAAFFPFLFGPFHCVGKMFAYQEMRLFIATLLWKYDMKFAPGFDSYKFEASIIDNGTLLEIEKPLEVIVTRRKRSV